MFSEGIKGLTDGTIDWDTDTIRAVLMLSSFGGTTLTATNVEAFDAWADLPVADKAAGVADTNKTVTVTADIIVVSASDKLNYGDGTTTIVFATVAAGQECKGIVIYKSGGGDQLICYNHFTSAVTADGGSVNVTIDTKGLFRVSY
jgi:hypothetical protein